MRQIFLTKEHLIRYLDPLDSNSRIEFDIQHKGKTYHVDHIRGFSRITDSIDGISDTREPPDVVNVVCLPVMLDSKLNTGAGVQRIKIPDQVLFG